MSNLDSWKDEYLKERQRISGRICHLKEVGIDKFLVVDDEFPLSAEFTSGIMYTKEKLLQMTLHLKSHKTFSGDYQ